MIKNLVILGIGAIGFLGCCWFYKNNPKEVVDYVKSKFPSPRKEDY